MILLKYSRAFGFVLASLGVLMFTGCGTSSLPTATRNPVTGKTELSAQGVHLGDDIAIPSDFPSDIPRYTGAKTHVALVDSNQQTASLQQETPDDLATVRATLEAAIMAQGFKKGTELNEEGMQLVQYTKEKEMIQLQLVHDASQAMTSIIIARSVSS